MNPKTETKGDPVLAREFFADKSAFTIGPMEVSHEITNRDEINILDVREARDYYNGHIPGARNLPPDQWWDSYLLSHDRINVLYCQSETCGLAAQAAMQFAKRGFSVIEMNGGFEAWKKYDLPVEK